MISALIAALIALRDSGSCDGSTGCSTSSRPGVVGGRLAKAPRPSEFDPKDTYRDRHRRTAPAVVGAIPTSTTP